VNFGGNHPASYGIRVTYTFCPIRAAVSNGLCINQLRANGSKHTQNELATEN
jgi:hypothetical protein